MTRDLFAGDLKCVLWRSESVFCQRSDVARKTIDEEGAGGRGRVFQAVSW